VVALGIAFAGLLGIFGPIIVAIGLTMQAFALLKGIQVVTKLDMAFRII
jgi:hypothetical protein